MRRIWIFIFLLVLACRSLAPFPANPLSTATSPPAFSVPSPLEPLPTATAPPATRQPKPEAPYTVRVHPDGNLYIGDQVSFEVIIPPERVNSAQKVSVRLEQEPLKLLAEAPTAPYGIGGRMQATLTWAWDTRLLEAGDYTLTFNTEPGGETWTERLSLLPGSEVPTAEQGAAWALANSACCVVYYLTGTAAERDLEELLEAADFQAGDVERRLGVQASQPITITLLPRLLGQGGFANEAINLSYLDRNYSAGDFEIILHHEMVHIFDQRLGGELRPSLLVEGLAVYLTGGHFKNESLLPRAAALPDTAGNRGLPGLGWYIPLQELADHFYTTQHETGYLEGGALVAYMVERWGWEAFSRFYRDLHPQPSGSQAEAIEAGLQQHFNLSLEELEAGFLERLRSERVGAGVLEDVRQTVNYYDTLRRYQALLDPSAYYLSAWLPDPGEMRRRGIVADYLRQEVTPIHLALETLLAETGSQLRQGNYGEVGRNLRAIKQVLDGFQAGETAPFQRDATVNDYYQVVLALLGEGSGSQPGLGSGFLPQKIKIEGSQAQAWISLGRGALKQVSLVRTPTGWRLISVWEGMGRSWNSAFSTAEQWKRLNPVEAVLRARDE